MTSLRRIALFSAAVAALAAAAFILGLPQFETSLVSLSPAGEPVLPQAVSKYVSCRVQAVASAKTHEKALSLAEEFVSSLGDGFRGSVRFRVDTEAFSEMLEFYRRHRGGLMSARDAAAEDGALAQAVLSRIISPAPSLFRFKDDPYRFLDGFVKDLPRGFGMWQERGGVLAAEKDGQNHVLVSLELPQESAMDIETLPAVLGPAVENSVRLNSRHKEAKISLCGVPVHTLGSSGECKRQITALSVFSMLFVTLLALAAFRSIKPLAVTALNLMLSATAGFAVLALVFDSVHLVSLVLGTTLIGLAVDYSFHRMLSSPDRKERRIPEDMFKAWLTTLVSFLPLAFSGVSALVQSAVFIAAGLSCSLLFNVFCVLRPAAGVKPSALPAGAVFHLISKAALPLLAALALSGFFTVRFFTGPGDVYSPGGELKASEKLVADLGGFREASGMVVVRGADAEEAIAKEESLGLPGIGISRFLPSYARRLENYSKQKAFHEKHALPLAEKLGSSVKFPGPEKPVEISAASIPSFLSSQFLFPDGPSGVMTIVPGVSRSAAEKAGCLDDFYAPGEMLARALDVCGQRALAMLAVSFVSLAAVLFAFYRLRALKMLLPPLLSVSASFALIGAFSGNVNFFHLLASFMVVGMALDYTIFLSCDVRANMKAVVCSLLSSMAAFGALSVVSFPVVRSLGVMLGCGLPLSFVAAWALFRPRPNRTETAASRFGLETAWLLYRLFGKRALDAVAIVVANAVWAFDAEARATAQTRRRLVNFALSLSDKMAVLADGSGQPEVVFDDCPDAAAFLSDVTSRKGVVVISSHLGNIETLAAYGECPVKFHVFMSFSLTGIFRAFKERHSRRSMIEIHPTEGFSMAELFTGADIVDRGEVVLIAGDRGSGRTRKMAFCGGERCFPEGSFRFAELLERPVYFVASVRERGGYRVFVKRLRDGRLIGDYAEELARLVEKYPDQWYQWERKSDG